MPGYFSGRNSTQTLLDADASFVGEWEINDYEHVAINCGSDVAGTLTIHFGVLKDGSNPLNDISDGDVIETFSQEQQIYAGIPRFRPLVKGAGRCFKISYTNGGDAQSSFFIASTYGDALFPSSASPDGELLTTTTEQERDVFAALAFNNVTATSWKLLIDLSDNTTFPHDRTGVIDVTAAYISADRDVNGTGAARMGVITRIDGTNADVTFFAGVSFEKSSERNIIRDRRASPSQWKLDVEGGVAVNIASGFIATNVTALNTATAIATPYTGVTAVPAVGDVVAVAEWSAGSFNASISCFYHTEDA